VERVLRVLTFDGSRLYMEGTRREKVWAVVELAALLTTRLMPAPRVEFVETVIPTLAGVTSIGQSRPCAPLTSQPVDALLLMTAD
jgi:hypothetical protein